MYDADADAEAYIKNEIAPPGGIDPSTDRSVFWIPTPYAPLVEDGSPSRASLALRSISSAHRLAATAPSTRTSSIIRPSAPPAGIAASALQKSVKPAWPVASSNVAEHERTSANRTEPPPASAAPVRSSRTSKEPPRNDAAAGPEEEERRDAPAAEFHPGTSSHATHGRNGSSFADASGVVVDVSGPEVGFEVGFSETHLAATRMYTYRMLWLDMILPG